LTVAQQLAETGSEAWTIGRESSPLASSPKRHVMPSEATAMSPHSSRNCRRGSGPPQEALRACSSSTTSILLDAPKVQAAFQKLVRARGVRIVASIEVRSFTGYTSDALHTDLRKARQSLFLRPAGALDVFNATGVRPPLRPGLRMPPGRGVLVVGREAAVVQVAKPQD
jgi:hypothetical protein